MSNCADMMYPLYPPYFPHKTSTNDISKYGSTGSVPVYDHASTAYPSIPESVNTNVTRNADVGSANIDMEAQPKASHYVNPNCVLLNYFTGDTATVVDEHFSRALSQPSSFTADRGTTPLRKTDKPLMCHRKLPPSFWNSTYRPPATTNPLGPSGGGLDYSRDTYFSPSWYSLQNNWPYRLPSHGHSDIGQSLSYPSLDTSSKLSNPYQSFVFPGSYDSRPSKFDFSKNMDPLSGSSGYYGLSRLGMDFPSKSNIESTVSGLEYQLQSARRELCW
ncbi:transcription cofactor vestigial-like protein 2 isoform X1 [Mizuhopecten yessoensis]|uniref:Transcription cofactor vestigial-like protein 2 n=1 Tax=Mizuhopecten yessoensis TaxID=6573 RepID=A0A210PY14_MIZYE|nr:transcription cofactor vestigial-like protein 2 isoform X1 [Mizuhopecten yessoensis]OWF41339.1 Transcription cofactor vestigial-like protein 2 [Mizuhopecten yessoensis]